ncbi:MAG: hypothetical protein ACXADL_01160 [Candidatus Thorarchaeota archaeon]|jgi:hypothetical protein
MNSQKTTLSILLEDVKVSFKFAVKNIISFFLGMLGVVIVSVIILASILLVVLLPVFLAGLPALFELFTSFLNVWTISEGAMAIAVILAIFLPLTLPLFAAIGALYGMAREVVESEGTTAEGVFTWYKRKFFGLAGGGIILFTISILPIVVVLISYILYFGMTFDPFANSVLVVFGIIWLTITLGAQSMLFPGIIDGLSPLAALRQSFRMSWNHFERVFGIWLLFTGILVAMLMPIILPALFLIPGLISGQLFDPLLLMTYAPIMVILLILVVFPARTIAMTRVYMILSAENAQHVEESHPDFSFVGGF